MQKLPKNLKLILTFLKEKKTTFLKVLNISEVSILSDYFIIVSMSNEKSVNSLANDIIDLMSNNNYDIKGKEGINTKWVLLDYGDIVIHILDEEYKSLYNLEKLWADAKEIDT